MSADRNIQYFSSDDDGMMVKIIVCAVVFHLLIAGICIAFHFVNFKHEPEPIPVFEMVQVQQPVQPRPQPPRPKPVEPKPEQPKPIEPKPKPEPKPKVDQQLPPEPKVEDKPPEPEPVEEPQPEPEPEPEPQDDFEVDDLDLPAAVEAPSLNPVGSVDMDPLMQVYLERLKQIIMSNFNPIRLGIICQFVQYKFLRFLNFRLILEPLRWFFTLILHQIKVLDGLGRKKIVLY